MIVFEAPISPSRSAGSPSLWPGYDQGELPVRDRCVNLGPMDLGELRGLFDA
jgi:hypothetical protein